MSLGVSGYSFLGVFGEKINCLVGVAGDKGSSDLRAFNGVVIEFDL